MDLIASVPLRFGVLYSNQSMRWLTVSTADTWVAEMKTHNGPVGIIPSITEAWMKKKKKTECLGKEDCSPAFTDNLCNEVGQRGT